MSVGKDVGKLESFYVDGGNEKQWLWKRIWQFLKKLNVALPYDAAIPVLGIFPKELKEKWT